MKTHDYYVYLMTNQNNRIIYTGVTNDLARRVWEHKTGQKKNSFTYKYNINKLVYYEHFNNIEVAIAREKQIKAGNRKRKIGLIESTNKEWNDLSADWY